MNRRMTAFAATLLAAGFGSPLPAQTPPARPPGVTRVDLQRHDLSIAGNEAVQARVDFEPGTRFPRHTHPGEEIIYVLEGTLIYEVEGRPPATLKAGDVLFVPSGTVHSASNPGDVRASELATFVVAKGKPLATIVE